MQQFFNGLLVVAFPGRCLSDKVPTALYQRHQCQERSQLCQPGSGVHRTFGSDLDRKVVADTLLACHAD